MCIRNRQIKWGQKLPFAEFHSDNEITYKHVNSGTKKEKLNKITQFLNSSSPPVIEELEKEEIVRPCKYHMRQVEIETLHNRYQRGTFNLNPKYQRGDVWSGKTRRILIEDILYRSTYVPAIVTSEKPDATCDVVDGKQRLTSIFQYIENEFTVRRKFFRDLPKGLQEHFRRSMLCESTHRDLSVEEELELFKRLQNGVTLSSGEKLNARVDPLMTHVKSWVDSKYKDVFFERTGMQKNRFSHYSTALVATIMIVEKGKPVTLVESQLKWLTSFDQNLHKNIVAVCENALRKTREVRTVDLVFFDTSLSPLEVSYLIFFMSTPEGRDWSTNKIITTLKRVNSALKGQKFLGTSTKSLEFVRCEWNKG